MKRITLALIAVALLAAPRADARAPAAAASLAYGPFQVGFQLLVESDPTRSYPSGIPETPAARPMRVYVWYPAGPAKGPALTIGDFVTLAADDFRQSTRASRGTGTSRVLPVPLAKGLEAAELDALLASATRSIRNAGMQPGSYPLLVVGQGLYYESPLSHVVLCEYLASRGYVVVTCPLLGTQSRLVNLSVEDLETATRDLEYVVAAARRLVGRSRQPLGVIGYDLGGMSGLLLSMRNPQVAAFLSLDAGIQSPHRSGLPGAHPQYREGRFVIPWMHMTQSRAAGQLRQAWRDDPKFPFLFERKTFGDNYLVSVPTDSHGTFSSYAMFGIRRELSGYWGAVTGDPRPIYEEILRLSGVFFDATLKGDRAANAELAAASVAGSTKGSFPLVRKEGARRLPSSADIINDIIDKGVAHVRPAIEQARSAAPDRPVVDESELNWLGYHFLLWWGRERDALDVFRLNAELYPSSANAFDSLGEGYLAAGRTDEAIAAYRKSLDIDPGNTNAAAVLARLTRK
jgi:hypothetical protein